MPNRAIAWLVLALMALANFGNYYVYDSIGPIADLLQRQRDFSDSQIGMLNAIYSLPNVVLILLGGILVDRFGAARMLVWTALICLAGTITAWSPSFSGMAADRCCSASRGDLQHRDDHRRREIFLGRNWRLRSGPASRSDAPSHSPPTCRPVRRAYAGAGNRRSSSQRCWQRCRPRPSATGGWTTARRARIPACRLHTAVFAARSAGWRRVLVPVGAVRTLVLGDSRFAAFAIKYFQHAHELDWRPRARSMQVFRGAVRYAGLRLVCDRTSRYAPWLLSAPCCCRSRSSSWRYPAARCGSAPCRSASASRFAVMFFTAKLVPQARLGTAIGLMWVVQNAGMAGANIVAGWLNDSYRAGPLNPAGYEPMMIYFFLSSALGFVFAMLLWRSAGRGHHEAVTHAR
jgi:MFS family permease